MRFTFSILIIFFSTQLYSQTCSQNGTGIVYINGGNVDAKAFKIQLVKYKQIITTLNKDILDSKGKVTLDYSYNGPDLPIVLSEVTTGLQNIFLYVQSSMANASKILGWSDAQLIGMYLYGGMTYTDAALIKNFVGGAIYDQFLNIVKRFYQLTRGSTINLANKVESYLSNNKKVITLPYSQGTILDNDVYEIMLSSSFTNKKNFYGTVHLANTDSRGIVNPKNYHITTDLDLVAPFLGFPSNFTVIEDDDDRFDPFNHYFLETYASTEVKGDLTPSGSNPIFTGNSMAENMYYALKEVSRLLDSNCNEVQGCDGAPGWSPQSNVFVANTARLDPSVTIPPLSPFLVEICEGAQVYDTATISGKVKISGLAQVHGNANINGFASGLYIDGSADITGNIQAYGFLWITGSTKINEGSYVYGKGTFDGDTVIGSASDVTLDGTHVTDSQIFNSKVYADSYVTNSRIENSDVKTSFVSGSIITGNSKIVSSGVDASTITNSTITNSSVFLSTITNQSTILDSSIEVSSINGTTVAAGSYILGSSLSGGTCTGAYIFNGSGQGCSGGSSGTYTPSNPDGPMASSLP